MNKSFCYILISLLLTVLLGCDEDYDTIFEETPDERLQSTLDEYTSMLTSQEAGWKAALTTGTDRNYFYYFEFNGDGNVTMVSDFDQTTAGTPATSSWMLKALQRPTLSFNTYSYIHLPADPDGEVNGGADGEGLVSDFEFIISEVSGDSIILEGLQRGSSLIMVPASPGEKEAILDQEILKVFNGVNQTVAANRGLKFALADGAEVPVVINMANRLFGAQYLAENGSEIVSFQTGFSFDLEGIKLSEPFEINGQTIQYLTWDELEGAITIDLQSTTPLVGFDDPFIFDVTPPLSSVLGSTYSTVLIPASSGQAPLVGQSENFINIYNTAADALLNGTYQLTLRDIEFLFDEPSGSMRMNVYISQTNNGASSLFVAQYSYSYVTDEDGLLKFSFLDANDNGWTIYGDIYDLLFPIEADYFQAEYIGGDLNLLAGFFSQDTPEFHFSGYLYNN
ncbi:DUF4302 domain-containing protein [Fulvivirga maritima]|uniref:DUF4302 domain-containing protein n=1 Tax=Fulvivirga maritima TaxID=2904247 RepID=UPI001F483BB7|nr:DUF4302 domain-containing protein [Fulvivirga maritima]UII27177.1 DUF4302 domain-containing protein [Fulvivirga maritima]